MSRIGIVTPYWNDTTPEEIVRFARLAEELGYDSIWIPEMWGRDAFTLATLIAINTERVKIATGVVSVFSRSPAVIASTFATIDELSGGRAVLGLGTSGPAVIEGWHGINYNMPLKRTREYIDIVRLIVSGARANYDGKIFKLKNFRLMFEPFRKEVPIFLAAMGPKNTELAGEAADGWIPYLIPVGSLSTLREHLAQGAAKGGRRVEEITIAPYLPACVHGSGTAGADTERVIKEHIAYYIGGMGTFYSETLARCGFEREAKGIKEAWENRDKSKAVESVSDELLHSVAVIGTKDGCLKKIEEFRREGAGLPVLMFPPKATREMARDTMEALAPRYN